MANMELLVLSIVCIFYLRTKLTSKSEFLSIQLFFILTLTLNFPLRISNKNK